MSFTKMDKIWLATALLLYPETSAKTLVSLEKIQSVVQRRFATQITPIMATHHLVSWVDRQADKSNPMRGGSRNRYLYRTLDGRQPSGEGSFRLYKSSDSTHDGWDKTGKIRPQGDDIPSEYHYLLDWHVDKYFEG